MADAGITEYRLRKYPSCIECNSLLGALNLSTLDERRKFLRKRYEKRYSKWLRVPSWGNEDFNEISEHLAEDIKKSIRYSEFVKERIAWLSGNRG
jgi:hypothetical protein